MATQRAVLAALFAGALAAFTGAAHAAPLPPGTVVFTNGVTVSDSVQDPVARPYLGGAVLNDNLLDFTYDPTPSIPLNNVGGRLQNRVVDNGSDLIFMTRIRDTFNIDGGTFSILGMTIEGYGNVDLDVDFRLDGLGDKGFSSASRSADGDRLTLRYEDRIFVDAFTPPGRQQTSYFPALLTNASAYDFSGTATIFGEILPLGATDSSASVQSNIFSFQIDGIAVPRADVPAPASLALLVGSVAALGLRRRLSRNNARTS
ncbi:MAG: hypothetical protein AB8B93_20730 [Pseudomonadales bacterium]